MLTNRWRRAIIGIVTTVWVANFGLAAIVSTYKPDEFVNGIFMAIVGGVFIDGARKERDDDDGAK